MVVSGSVPILIVIYSRAQTWFNFFTGSNFDVRSYGPRPKIVILPPPRSTRPWPQTLTFIQAVTRLPCVLSDENLTMIFQTVGDHERGQLRRLFVVLNDDDHDRCLNLVKEYHENRRRGGRSDPATHSGTVSGPGIGMETSSGLIESLRHPPPPPPPDSKSKDSVAKDKSEGRGGLKRAHQTETESESPSVRDDKRARRSPSSSDSSSSSSASSASSSSSSSGSRRRHRSKKKSKKSKSKSKKHRK